MVFKVTLPSDIQTGDNRGTAASSSKKATHPPQFQYALKSLNPTRIEQRAAASKDNKDTSTILASAAEELYREAVILAECHHPHIIKLRGHAVEGLVGSFSTTDFPLSARGEHGYFLVLDLISETLEERLPKWREYQQPRGIAGRLGRRLSKTKKSPSSSSLSPSPPKQGPFSMTPAASTSRIQEESNESRGELAERIAVATAIASAVTYLHTQHHIVVRDLCPESIGFDARTGQVKLFDLGLARSPQECRLDIQLEGNFRYMAPEIILCQPSGLPGDIYSFAVILWELATLERPYDAFFTPEPRNHKSSPPSSRKRNEVFAQSKFTNEVILNYWRPNCADIADLETRRLIQECWCSDPEARPNAEQVEWRLEQSITMRHQLQERRSSWRRPSITASPSMERVAHPKRKNSFLRAFARGSGGGGGGGAPATSNRSSSSKSSSKSSSNMAAAAARVAADASLYMDLDSSSNESPRNANANDPFPNAPWNQDPVLPSLGASDSAIMIQERQPEDDASTSASLSLADFRSRLQLSQSNHSTTTSGDAGDKRTSTTASVIKKVALPTTTEGSIGMFPGAYAEPGAPADMESSGRGITSGDQQQEKKQEDPTSAAGAPTKSSPFGFLRKSKERKSGGGGGDGAEDANRGEDGAAVPTKASSAISKIFKAITPGSSLHRSSGGSSSNSPIDQ